MFMDKGDNWSDDELEDLDNDTLVVPMTMMPTPTVISGPLEGDPQFRASAYNERMARARNSSMVARRTGSGMIQTNGDRPSSARPPTAPLTLQQAPPIDVLSREIEEMELAEEQQVKHTAALYQQNENAARASSLPQYSTPPAQYAGGAAPIDIGDDGPSEQRLEPSPARPNHNAVTSHARPPEPVVPRDLPAPAGGSTSAQDSPPAQPLARLTRPLEGAVPAVIDTSDLRAFLLRPGPQGAMVQCYIQRRQTGMARLYPTYEVYLKDGEQFLLSARRRKKQKQSNYKVSLNRDDLSRHSSNFFGKLKSNFMGTEFQLYDSGINPVKLTADQRDGSGAQVRAELTTVLYKQNVLGSRGPRKMKVLVPNVEASGNRVVLKPTCLEDTMLERYKAGKELEDVQVLKNKQPKWNDQVGAYVLNFNGRVTRASVKNFQLCNTSVDPDLVVMQFGRVGKDAFTMDYQWPLCGLQAFGIALSSFDYKIACE